MRFALFSILLFFWGGISDLCSCERETAKLVEMNKESLCEQEDLDKSEKVQVSQFTQIVDEFVVLNKKYVIPFSYAYIGWDVSKNLFGIIANSLMANKGEKIFPYRIESNPLHQSIVSKVNEVAAKIGVLPWSIIIVDDKPNWWAAATDKNLLISRSFLVKDAEAEYILAHELSHIKNRHSSIVGTAIMVLANVFSIAQLKFYCEKNDIKNNFQKIIRMIYTSPLLYYFSAKIIWYAVARYCEKDADLTAATAVGAEGGISFFGRFLDGHKTGLFDSHPSSQERIDYLQAFKINN